MLNTCAQNLVDSLKSKNLDFETTTNDRGDSIILFPYQNKTARMFFSGDDGTYLSTYMVYERVPKDKVSEAIFACNDLNVEYKWITFYVDRDNDVILHNDAILAVDDNGEEAFELLVRMLKIGEDIRPTLMKAIYA